MASSNHTSRQQLIEQCLTDIDLYSLELHDQNCWICHDVMLPPKQDGAATTEAQKLGSSESTMQSPDSPITGAGTNKNTPADKEADGDDRSAVKVACGHTFCKYCISKWLSLSTTCPECRTTLFTAPTRRFFPSTRGYVLPTGGYIPPTGGYIPPTGGNGYIARPRRRARGLPRLAPTGPLTMLQRWQRDRESIIRNVTEIIRDESHPLAIPARRLRDFIMRETTQDVLPGHPMWAMIKVLGDFPARMTNHWVEHAIERLDEGLRLHPGLPMSVHLDHLDAWYALSLDLMNHT